ncbi:MAG TPA: DUF192 domain-containing protein, partial [Candidatus Paceibacterota bacterium]|nr:DUF192 domain-containing protein [Candidatus Paceibacterota bacterium]
MKYILLLVAGIVLAIGFFLYYSQHMQSSRTSGAYVSFGTTTVSVDVASTPQEQEQGLSGRASLAEGSGMLFVFDPDAAPGFWMKDMNFSLDIIFMKADGEVVGIEHDLAPDSY